MSARRFAVRNFPRPHLVRRDVCPRLEAICLKAMCRDSKARYASALLLADDLSRWMRDDEVSAAPDSRFQRLARFARRPLGSTVATFVSLLTVVIAVSVILRVRQLRGL